MSSFMYMHCDVPPGMDLREWRRAEAARKPRRRIRLPQRRHLSVRV